MSKPTGSSSNPLRAATGFFQAAKEETAKALGISKTVSKGEAAAKPAEPGDYVVRVTVHEVESLAPQDWGGTNDPFVAVTCCGKSYQTDVVPKVNSAQYDSSFIFELSVRQTADLDLETVLFRAVDSNFPFPDKLIGSYELELSQVYKMRRHELTKEWVALVGVEGGCAGYLLVTVSVTNVKEQLDDEEEEDVVDSDQIQFPSSIQLEQFELLAEVFRGEGLPAMDTLSKVTGGAGLDPFVAMSFGASGTVRTEIASKVEGSTDRRNPLWRERLRLPVAVPAMSGATKTQSMLVDRVRISLVDHDFGRADVLVGQLVLKFSDIRANMYSAIGWHNLYGPAPGTADHDVGAMMRGTVPASQFRGRLLMRITAKPNKRSVHKSVPGQNSVLDGIEEPREVLYRPRAEIFEAFGLPLNGDVRVAVSLANVRAMQPRPQPVVPDGLKQVGGRAHFMQLLSPEPISSPEDPRQAPDVFIEIWDVPATKLTAPTMLCYARLRAEELVTEATMQKKPVWVQLMHGPGMDPYTPPAWIQVKVHILRGNAAKTPDLGKQLHKPPVENYRFRATVYQARHLPCAFRETAADPYVVLRGASPTMYTSVKQGTTFPLWWEPLTDRVQLPVDLEIAPKVSMLVLDRNNCCRADAVLAWAEFDVQDFQKKENQAPQWRELTVTHAWGITADARKAEVLVSFELLEDLGEQPPRPVVPKRRRVTVAVTAVGLRGLLPLGAFNVHRAQIVISVETYRGAQQTAQTKVSHEPTPDAPNFLEVLHLPIDMPENPMFAPTLRIDVVDERPFGARALLGTAFVQLAHFLPEQWPPGSDLRSSPSAETRTRGRNVLRASPSGVSSNGSAGGLSRRLGSQSPTRRLGSPSRGALEVRIDVGGDDAKLRRRMGRGSESGAAASSSKGQGEAAGGPSEEEMVDEAWKRGRKQYRQELEKAIDCAPFEEFVLKRKSRVVGKFKGKIEIIDGSYGATEDSRVVTQKALQAHMLPKDYTVRVYVIKTHKLLPPAGIQPKDLNPYLKIFLANKEYNLRSEGCRGTDDPDFRCVRQLQTKLPGRCKLQVQVWHAGSFLQSDILLGSTELDMEDRVLSDAWRAAAESSDGQPKTPIELRPLMLGSQCRGKLQMLVDILDPAKAREVKIMDVALPLPQKFVMRVVVWGARDVPAPPHLLGSGMIDMYVRLILEGQPPDKEGDIRSTIQRWTEETDTHWRAKKGRGSFNWRAVFDLELPMNRTRLLLQLWDHDILTPSGFIGQGGIELDPLLKLAWNRYEAAPTSRGAVFHWPDRGSRPADPKKKLKKVDHEGKSVEESEFTGAKSAWDFLCRRTKGAYQQSRSMVAEKGKGDGDWIELKSNKAQPAGYVSVSITVMHESVAAVQKAGPGRSDPNSNPKLPAPERTAWNPLRPDLVLLDLVGPEIVTAVFILGFFILFAIFSVHSLPIVLTLIGTKGASG